VLWLPCLRFEERFDLNRDGAEELLRGSGRNQYAARVVRPLIAKLSPSTPVLPVEARTIATIREPTDVLFNPEST
jgi:hypothetical protein